MEGRRWNAQPDFVETTQGVVQGKYERKGREKEGRMVSRSRASLDEGPKKLGSAGGGLRAGGGGGRKSWERLKWALVE
jgi:hypothetical protein